MNAIFFFGSLFLLVGCYSLSSRLSQLRNFIQVAGTVESLTEQIDIDSASRWVESVSFIAHDGDTYTVVHSVGFPAGDSVGEERLILYRESNPADAHVYSTATFWVAPSAIAILGAILLLSQFTGHT